MICDHFNVLPTNDNFKNLNQFQKRWLIYNIVHQREVENEMVNEKFKDMDMDVPVNKPMRKGADKQVFDMGEKFEELEKGQREK